MRIVAGSFGGRRLNVPKGLEIRPTSDRVREAIFNIIGQAVVGARVLDLFAGTGALGLEALSRGALRAVFIDKSPDAVRLIQSNIKRCGVQDRVTVIPTSAAHAIRRLRLQGEDFDLVFLDPPYDQGLVQENLLSLADLAHSGTLVVAEHHHKELLPSGLQEWVKTQARKYGDTAVSFYARELAS